MPSLDPVLVINLALYGTFFAVGTAFGFVISRVRHQALQAIGLLAVGLMLGGFLGYLAVMSQVFSIETHVGPAPRATPNPTPATPRGSNARTQP